MDFTHINMRVSREKKKEIQDAARAQGVSVTAYFLGLHHMDQRRDKAINQAQIKIHED